MMFSYAYDHTPEVEVGSIDEGYFDLRSNKKQSARFIAETIRDTVSQTLKLSASFGIGSNKLVSQIASQLNKPRCFIEVPGGTERGFMAPLSNRCLPNIGPKVGTTLDAAGLKRVEQIAQTCLVSTEGWLLPFEGVVFYFDLHNKAPVPIRTRFTYCQTTTRRVHLIELRHKGGAEKECLYKLKEACNGFLWTWCFPGTMNFKLYPPGTEFAGRRRIH